MRIDLLLLAAPVLSPAAAAHDDLLVGAFGSSSFTRYDADSGAFVGAFGPGPLAGTLGADVGPDGAVYVCSETTNQVLRYHATTGAYLDAFVEDDPNTPQDETGGLDGPSDVLFGPDGRAYVASFNSDAVLRYDGRTGVFDQVFVQPGSGALNGPDAGMAFGTGGDLYVPSFWNNRVKRYDATTGAFVENFLSPIGSGLNRPRTVLFPGDGFVYVTSEGNDRVLKFDASDGTYVGPLVWDDPNTTPDETGGLDAPTGMGLGPDGRLYVASLGTDEVLRYDFATGAFVDVFVAAGSGGIALPTFLMFRPGIGKYCAGAPNSAGPGASIGALGFTTLAADDLVLTGDFGPPGEPALFVYGPGPDQIPVGDGTLCVGGALHRLPPTQFDPAGHAEHALDFGSPPIPAGQITAGSTWHFQLWYRDPSGPLGTGFNFSDAFRATFRP